MRRPGSQSGSAKLTGRSSAADQSTGSRRRSAAIELTRTPGDTQCGIATPNPTAVGPASSRCQIAASTRSGSAMRPLSRRRSTSSRIALSGSRRSPGRRCRVRPAAGRPGAAAPREERLDRRRTVGRHRGGSQLGAGARVAAGERGLDAPHLERPDADLVEAQPDEERDRGGTAPPSSPHRPTRRRRVGVPDHPAEQPHQRGVERGAEVGDRPVAAIGREHVLGRGRWCRR